MDLRIEIEREDDGRWIADIPEIPGVMAYGATRGDAVSRAEILALRVAAPGVSEPKPDVRWPLTRSAARA